MTIVYACQHSGYCCQLCLRLEIFERQYNCFQGKNISSNGIFSPTCASLQTYFSKLQQPMATRLKKSGDKLEINGNPKPENTRSFVICLSNLFWNFLGFHSIIILYGYHYCHVPSFWYISWKVVSFQFVVVFWLPITSILWLQIWKNLNQLPAKVPCRQAPLSSSRKYVLLSCTRFAIWYSPVQRKSNLWLNWSFSFVLYSRTRSPMLSFFVRNRFCTLNFSFPYSFDCCKCITTSCKSLSFCCSYLAHITNSLPIV